MGKLNNTQDLAATSGKKNCFFEFLKQSLKFFLRFATVILVSKPQYELSRMVMFQINEKFLFFSFHSHQLQNCTKQDRNNSSLRARQSQYYRNIVKAVVAHKHAIE